MKGRGPKYPAAHKINGVVAPVAFYVVVAATAVHGQDRRVRGSSHRSLSVSVLRLCSETRRLQPLLAFGLWPIFFCNGFVVVLARSRFKRDNGSFRTVLFSVPSTHFIASPRSPGIGRFLETASGCQPMPLRVGAPEWASSLFLRKDRGLRVPLHPSQYEFDGFSEAVSSMYTRVLAGLSVLPDHGRLELPKRT